MYYRRKVILALIEQFWGKLKPTHFQKLLLLFTRRQQKAAYEFVPFRYGAFSFQARADKGTMIKYELLNKHERVAITCFEKEHTSCHRHKISDHMKNEFGVAVEHI